MNKNTDTKLFPLCSTQKILLMEQLRGSDREGAAEDNMINCYVFIEKDFDKAALERAFMKLIEVNDALRLRLVRKGIGIYQYFFDGEQERPVHISVSGKQEFEAAKKDISSHKIPPFGGALYRAFIYDCGEGIGGMLMRFHHLTCDGYSLGIMFKQLDEFYKSYKSGEEPKLSKIYSFEKYCEEEKNYIASDKHKEDIIWWRDKYNSQRDFDFPAGRGGGKGDCKRCEMRFDGEPYARFVEFCKNNGCSGQSSLMTLAAICTAVLTGKENFSICSLFHGRTTMPMKRTVGCILSNFYVYYDLATDMPLDEYIKKMYMEFLESLMHGRLSPMRMFPVPYKHSIRRFFNFNYVWLEFSAMDFAAIASKLSIEAGAIQTDKSRYQIYCAVLDVAGKALEMPINYQPATVPEEKIEKARELFIKCFDKLLERPSIPVSELIAGLKESL